MAAVCCSSAGCALSPSSRRARRRSRSAERVAPSSSFTADRTTRTSRQSLVESRGLGQPSGPVEQPPGALLGELRADGTPGLRTKSDHLCLDIPRSTGLDHHVPRPPGRPWRGPRRRLGRPRRPALAGRSGRARQLSRPWAGHVGHRPTATSIRPSVHSCPAEDMARCIHCRAQRIGVGRRQPCLGLPPRSTRRPFPCPMTCGSRFAPTVRSPSTRSRRVTRSGSSARPDGASRTNPGLGEILRRQHDGRGGRAPVRHRQEPG